MGEKTDDLAGKAKEAAGDVTDDKGLEREGKVDQGKSDVKEKVGGIADTISDKVKDVVN